MSDRPERTDLANLIAQAAARSATDPRHAAILTALKRLPALRAFGARLGDEKHKPILEYDNYEK